MCVFCNGPFVPPAPLVATVLPTRPYRPVRQDGAIRARYGSATNVTLALQPLPPQPKGPGCTEMGVNHT